MISTIYNSGCNFISQQCQSLINKSHTLRYEAKKIFDAVCPHQTARRYAMTEIAPRALKVVFITGSAIATAYSLKEAGNLFASVCGEVHNEEHALSQMIYDEILGACIVVPSALLAGAAIQRIKEGGKDTLKDILRGAGLTVGVVSAILANQTLGHYAVSYMRNNISKIGGEHPRTNLMMDFVGDSFVGIFPSAAIIASIGGSVIGTWMCIEWTKEQKERYKTWQEEQKKLLNMEEAKEQ